MPVASSYRFGPYRFDAAGRVLYRGGQDLGLPPKAADVLGVLLSRAGSAARSPRRRVAGGLPPLAVRPASSTFCASSGMNCWKGRGEKASVPLRPVGSSER